MHCSSGQALSLILTMLARGRSVDRPLALPPAMSALFELGAVIGQGAAGVVYAPLPSASSSSLEDWSACSTVMLALHCLGQVPREGEGEPRERSRN